MTEKPPLADRMIAYVAEQTGLPRETVEKVIDAQLRFYLQHPGNIHEATDTLQT